MRPVLGPLWASESGGSERRQGRQVRPNPCGAKAWPVHLHSSRPPLGGRVTTVQTEDCTTPGAPCPRLTSPQTHLQDHLVKLPLETGPERSTALPWATATKGPRAPDSAVTVSAQAIACLNSPGGAGSASPKRGSCLHFPPTLPGATTFHPLILSQLHY